MLKSHFSLMYSLHDPPPRAHFLICALEGRDPTTEE